MMKKKSSAGSFISTLKKTTLVFYYLCVIFTIGTIGFLYHLSQNLPSLEELANPTYDLPSQIFDRNNNLITEFYTKRRVLIPIQGVPQVMIQALLAIEDNRFYNHFGIDPPRMLRALIIDIMEGGWVQGASTLTQQTAKMFLLTPDRKLIRKLKEILLAFKIESRFSKNQILELYLNKAYFGHGAYGIEAASQTYFDKSASDLSLEEAALLAGLPQAPSKLAPTNNMKRAVKRRNLVLKKMLDLGYISQKRKQKAVSSLINLKSEKITHYNEVSYYIEHVRKYIYEKYGEDKLYRGGLKVYTEMDLAMQIYAQNALHKGLLEHDKRQGYRGPKKNLMAEAAQELGLIPYDKEKTWNPAKYKFFNKAVQKQLLSAFEAKIQAATKDNHFIIGGNILGIATKVNTKVVSLNIGGRKGRLFLDRGMNWARPVDYEKSLSYKTRLKSFRHILRVGDIVKLKILDYNQNTRNFVLSLTQRPAANGAIIVMDPNNCQVLAMAGGFDFRESQFNRAVQGKRQTGSAFKPIVYSLGLEGSFTASSILEDTPLVGKGQYKPKNYSKKFQGNISLREALAKSKNIPSLRLGKELTTKAVIQHSRKLGITGNMPENDITIVLGSASITLEEMTTTYSIFANGGYVVKPTFIKQIHNREGKLLENNSRSLPKRVLSPQTAFITTNILRDVVERGTGWRAKAINRPSAGKTGTTNNYTDAWYIGYIPQLIAGVYTGFDKEQNTLGNKETGSRAAAPIWVDFMKRATASMSILPFEQPSGISLVKINPKSGLLDCQGSKNAKFEYYKIGTEPKQCHQEAEEEKKAGEEYDEIL